MGEGGRESSSRIPGRVTKETQMDIILYWIGILTGEDGQG